MRKFKKLGTGLALVASAATLTALAAGPALADPPSGTVPGLTDVVGVGSDTITPLFSGSPTENVSTSQALSFDYNNQSPAPANKLYSWDAVDASGAAGGPITAKGSSSTDTTCSTTRPNGSGLGIAELNKNLMDAGAYCVDFARSSRGPNAGSTDAFVKLASDSIGITYPSVSGAANPQPASLTLQNLIDIYNCNVTDWSQVGGSSAPIVPVLPQAGSGTRSTFLAALGISTIKSCVVNGSNASGPIEENTGLSAGNVAQFTAAGSQNDLFPYSIGDWIAQTSPAVQGTGAAGTPGGALVGGHASNIWGQGNLQQTQIVDDSGFADPAVTTNSFNQPVINPNWLSALDRTLYDVVRNGGSASAPAFPTTPAYDATALPAIFGPNGWICTSNAGQSDTVSYGFGLLGSNCGSLTAGT